MEAIKRMEGKEKKIRNQKPAKLLRTGVKLGSGKERKSKKKK